MEPAPAQPRWPRTFRWVGIAVLPTLVAVAIPAAVLCLAGEFVPVERIVRRQGPPAGPAANGAGAPAAGRDGVVPPCAAGGEAGPAPTAAADRRGRRFLYGAAYSAPIVYYKRLAAYGRSVDVLALGTSRVLQIRTEFFRDGVRFYNAGHATGNMAEFAPFLERYPAAGLPRMIVAGLDQNFFNDAWAEQQQERDRIEEGARSAFGVLEGHWKRVWSDLWRGKIPASALVRDRWQGLGLIGLTARVHRAGYRNDGSYRAGVELAKYDDVAGEAAAADGIGERIADVMARIARGRRRFQYGQNVSGKALADLDRFLALAREKRIEVVGFLPPLSNAAWTRMMALGEKYAYVRALPPAVEAVFSRHGFRCYDFSRLAAVGAGDEEILDGFHAGERAMGRVVLALAEKSDALAGVVDRQRLRAAIDGGGKKLSLFGDGE